MDERALKYAERLSSLIRIETVSVKGEENRGKFGRFHQALREMFPRLFAAAEFENIDDSILLRWKGKGEGLPILLMSHHDVVEAAGNWTHPAFSGDIAEDKVWGRGTLDTKGSLYSMLQAAEELIEEGFVPAADVWFESSCSEETDGHGADKITKELGNRGVRFALVLDEGGMIMDDPIGGVHGRFAMIGVGEKGCCDIKFTARSKGGHASTPPKDTPLVRLGRFMADVDSSDCFKADLPDAVAEMFTRLGAKSSGMIKFLLTRCRGLKSLICFAVPKISPTAGAMLRTTIAFTMCHGAEGSNVLPAEAYVIANMRFSHHQGRERSIEAVTRIAKQYDIETEIIEPGFASPIADYNSEGFHMVERAVKAVFPDVNTTPYLMTGASDARFFSRVSDCCLRFVPFVIDEQQLESMHGENENVDISTLAPAVDFYKYVIREYKNER